MRLPMNIDQPRRPPTGGATGVAGEEVSSGCSCGLAGDLPSGGGGLLLSALALLSRRRRARRV